MINTVLHETEAIEALLTQKIKELRTPNPEDERRKDLVEEEIANLRELLHKEVD